MLGELAVAALDLGIVQGRTDNGRAEIIEHDAAGDAAARWRSHFARVDVAPAAE